MVFHSSIRICQATLPASLTARCRGFRDRPLWRWRFGVFLCLFGCDFRRPRNRRLVRRPFRPRLFLPSRIYEFRPNAIGPFQGLFIGPIDDITRRIRESAVSVISRYADQKTNLHGSPGKEEGRERSRPCVDWPSTPKLYSVFW